MPGERHGARADHSLAPTLRQFHRLYKRAARYEIFVAKKAKTQREFGSTDTFVGDDMTPGLLHKRDVLRMRFAVGDVPPPTRG
jgi:hypothetical protein